MGLTMTNPSICREKTYQELSERKVELADVVRRFGAEYRSQYGSLMMRSTFKKLPPNPGNPCKSLVIPDKTAGAKDGTKKRENPDFPRENAVIPGFLAVETIGFEPTTPAVQGRCSPS